jgi:hypothetical protein
MPDGQARSKDLEGRIHELLVELDHVEEKQFQRQAPWWVKWLPVAGVGSMPLWRLLGANIQISALLMLSAALIPLILFWLWEYFWFDLPMEQRKTQLLRELSDLDREVTRLER